LGDEQCSLSGACKCALGYHKTICSVKSHSRANATFQTVEKHKSKENLFELDI